LTRYSELPWMPFWSRTAISMLCPGTLAPFADHRNSLYRFRPERHPSIPVLTSCNWERKFTLKVEVHGKLHGVHQDVAVFRSRYRSLRLDNPRDQAYHDRHPRSKPGSARKRPFQANRDWSPTDDRSSRFWAVRYQLKNRFAEFFYSIHFIGLSIPSLRSTQFGSQSQFRPGRRLPEQKSETILHRG
jgi:hypothetical protein